MTPQAQTPSEPMQQKAPSPAPDFRMTLDPDSCNIDNQCVSNNIGCIYIVIVDDYF